MKIKKNDNVIVLTGKDKGKTGKVLEIFDNDRVLVEGINMKKKALKSAHVGRRAGSDGQGGGLIEVATPVHVSNIAIVDPKSKKASRIGYKDIKGKKVRVAVKSGQEI